MSTRSSAISRTSTRTCPGYESQISNLKSQIILLRALPVWSERLGLNGKCDIVEVEESIARRRRATPGGIQEEQAAALRQRRRAALRPGALPRRNVRASRGARGRLSRGEQTAAGGGVHGGTAHPDRADGGGGACALGISNLSSNLRFRHFRRRCSSRSARSVRFTKCACRELTSRPDRVSRAVAALFRI